MTTVTVPVAMAGAAQPAGLALNVRTNASRAIVFHDHGATRPTAAKARWVLGEIAHHRLVPPQRAELSNATIARYYRDDIHQAIVAETETTTIHQTIPTP